MRIVITEPMHADAVARLAAEHDVLYDPTLFERRAELVAMAPELDAIVVMHRTQVRGELLHALSRCKAIGRLGVGLDNLDVAGCKARGIPILPATGANARSVAEYVITAALMLRRPGSYDQTHHVAAGQWHKPRPRDGDEVEGATLGVLGFGAIGQLVARLALALGMKVVAHTRTPPTRLPEGLHNVPMRPLREVLAHSDVLSIHLPLTDATRGLIDAHALATMPRGAVLINTARGAIVDDAALVAALRSGHLRGAALDVFDPEPLPAHSVFANPPPNLLLSPHVGSTTAQSERRVGDMVATRVLDALSQVSPSASVSP